MQARGRTSLHRMDIALITGADTALGQNLAEKLVRMGCRVHGLGNDFSKFTFAHRDFRAHAVDLTDLVAVRETVESILGEEKGLHILVHAIDVTPGTSFETLAVGNLEAVLKVALLGPVLLTRLALPNLIRFRGQILNILSSNKAGRPGSALNRLVEDGLRGLNQALLDSARERGLRLTTIILRHNEVLPEGGDALPARARIDPAHLARLVEHLLSGDDPNLPAEIILHPRTTAAGEALPATPLPVDPYSRVVLPPKEYFPPEPEKIATKVPDRIDRTIPYTDEELEDRIAGAMEEYDARQEGRSRRPDAKPEGPAAVARPASEGEGGEKRSGRRRRRRGRKGRRGVGEDDAAAATKSGTTTEPKPAPPAPAPAKKADKAPATTPRKTAKKTVPKKKAAAKKTAAKKAVKKATKKTARKTAAKKSTKKRDGPGSD